MPVLQLETFIAADLQACFNLSRNIDVHQHSMTKFTERAIGGRTSGLIELHETVSWRARHFGIPWKMTVRVIEFDSPHSFTDEMVSGPFSVMHHHHQFVSCDGGTIMKDAFTFRSPLGILGRIFDALVLKRYMRQLLEQRNAFIKQHAESTAI
jgi:ligand-binding SRPBCC domain-containing protein